MLSENIKALRKKKGFSQEMVAERLNIVRQTVSKWEKGYSVPDAEMLERLAELFEVSVVELLGKPEEKVNAAETSEIVQQLVLLNDHLARQSRMRRRMWKCAGIVLLSFVIIIALIMILSMGAFSVVTNTASEERITYELLCTLDGEEYLYTIVCDGQYQILEAGGDAWIANHVQTEQYGDANVLMAQIEDYFEDRNGTCEIAEVISPARKP